MTTTLTQTKTPIRAAVLEVLQVLDGFSSLLIKETDALRKSDFKIVDTLQSDKRVFARQYNDLVLSLSDRRGEMPQVDLQLREKLIKTRTRFTVILNDNMRALDLAKASAMRLSNRILEVARSAVTNERQTHYSKQGNVQSYKTSSLSLNLDQKL